MKRITLIFLSLFIVAGLQAQIKKKTVKANELSGANGATITNTETDTLDLQETVIKLDGTVVFAGAVAGLDSTWLVVTATDSIQTEYITNITPGNDIQITPATNGGLDINANTTLTGYLLFPDPGTNANSFILQMVADNSGTPQVGSIQTIYGANPYIRFSAPNAAGTETPTMDMRSDLISFFNGEAGIDYQLNFNGETYDGTITYMEDEDRFDFDNDVLVTGDLGVGGVATTVLDVYPVSEAARIFGSPSATQGLLHLRASQTNKTYLSFAEDNVADRGGIGFNAASDTMRFIVGGTLTGGTDIFDLTSAGASFTTGAISIDGVDYTFPASDGASGTALSTNGAGVLSWASVASDSVWSSATLGRNTVASGQLNFIASDNDQGNIAINTSDALTFNGFNGGVINYQSIDNGGVRIYGFDDQSSAYGDIYVDASGNTIINSVGNENVLLKTAGTTQGYAHATGLGVLDNKIVGFGSANDATISYDGTNLLINPQAVGSGFTHFTAGNVGIGVAPTMKLSVKATASAQAFEVIGSSGGYTNIDITGDRTTGNLGGLRFLRSGDAAGFFEMNPQADRSATYFSTGDGTVAATVKMALEQDGDLHLYNYLGIGATPTYPLDVQVTTPSANDTIARWGTSDDATRVFIDEDGDVYADGNLSIAGNLTPYGSMYQVDASNVIATTVQNQWVIVDGYSAGGELNGVTFAADSLTVANAGTYEVTVHISFSGTASDHFEGAVAINGTVDTNHKFSRTTGGTDTGTAMFSALYSVSANQGISVWVRNTDGSPGSMTVEDSNIVIKKL